MPKLLAIAILCVFSSTLSWAQGTAQIHGVVQDSSGAVISGATVKASQTEIGLVRAVTTEMDGSFIFPTLPLGPYTLEVSKEGFAKAVQSGIVLQVNSDPAVAITIRPGAITESVLVEANAAQVDTRAVGVGTVVENERILDLPLNGRQATDLITLNGAAVQTGSSPAYMMNSGVNIAVAGGTSYSIQYNLDGAPHIDVYGGTNLPLPFPDALQEFKLTTSAQEAASGGHSSASVNSVTKSGTNKFHGDLFEFLRNGDLNGRDFFAANNDRLKRNQFGGVLGGPIKKDKAFFFVGYQGTLTRQTPSATQEFVPTPKMETGDFSDYLSSKCPEAGRFNLGVVDANGHLTLPLSPAALKISARLPQPTNPCGLVFTGAPLHENRLQVPVRLDYQLGPKQTLFGRYIATRIDTAVPYELTHDVLATSAIGTDDLAQSLTVGDTYLISSSTINSFRVSGNRIGSNHPAPNFFSPSDVGIQNFYSYIPNFTSLLFGTASIGFPANFLTENSHVTSFGANDDVTIVRGSHQISVGGSVMHAILVSNSYAWAAGTFIFAGIPGVPSFLSTGTAIGDFLTGKVIQNHQSNPNPEYFNQEYVGVYASDVWKVSPKFTLNYGLRWNPFFAPVYRQSDVTSFNLANFYKGITSKAIPTAPPGFTYPGDPGFNGRSAQPNQLGHFEPRIGFAFDPFGDGKTAIRSGAGIAYDFVRMDLNEDTSVNSPFRLTTINSFVSLDNPYANVPGGNPFPFVFNRQNPSFPSFPPFQGFLLVPQDLKTTKQYSWNFGVQRQVNSAVFASATYIGTQLIHTLSSVDLNPAQFIPGNCTAGQYGLTAPGPCSTGNNIDYRRTLELTNPAATRNLLGSLTQMDDGGTQRYNGLLLNATWRRGNVNLSGNYTWSHCTGLLVQATTLNPGNAYPHQAGQNNGPVGRNLDYGDCSGASSADIRQIGNLTLVATTPRLSSSTLGSRLVSGWTFSTIYTRRSGMPLTPSVGSDIAMNGLYTAAGNYPMPQRPNQVLLDTTSPLRGQSCSPAPCVNYFNPAAFALPALGTYGNMGVGSLRGPGFWEWDQTVSRQFRITESQRIEVRAEAFNVTNSVRFAAPSTLNASSGSFGRITSSQPTTGGGLGNGGRIMQFALKYVF
jgi:hypothetical protein